MNKFYLYLFVISILLSCSSDSDKEMGIKEQEINLPPNYFEVTIMELAHDSALVTWNPATDPEDEIVSYSIYLGQNKIIENLTELEFLISDLTELTEYSGQVIAKDSHGNTTPIDFSFRTKKYYLTFDHRIVWDEDNRTEILEMYEVLITEDNGYLFCGETNQYQWGGDIFSTIKFDENGNEVWRKSYEVFAGDSFPEIKKTNDGGYVVVGETSFFKLNSFGELEWSKTLENDRLTNIIYSIVQTQDNGYIVAGHYSYPSSIVQETDISLSAYIIKFDYQGNFVWDKKFGDTFSQKINRIISNDDDTYMLFGSHESTGLNYEGFINRDPSSEDYWIVKIDGEGNILMEASYDGVGLDFPRKIIKTSDGNFVFVGFTSGYYSISTGHIYKISPDGEIIWHNTYQYGSEDMVWSVTENSEGEFLTIGKITSFYLGNMGIYKFSANGDLIWDKQFIESSDIHTVGYDIKNTSDGGYIIAGMYSEIAVTPPTTYTRFWKTDPSFEF